MTDEEMHQFMRGLYKSQAGNAIPRPFIGKAEGRWFVRQNHEHWMLMRHYPELYADAIDRVNKAFDFTLYLASKEEPTS